MAEEELSSSLEFTPTWVVAGVCFVIVLLSVFAERGLHKLGKYLLHEKQDALYEALQKLKDALYEALQESTDEVRHHHRAFFKERADGYWRRAAIIGWMIAFFKQFYGSVTKSDYIALRQGFIKEHCPGSPDFDFHKYMMRTLEIDFRKIVGISWYLWLFVVLFLLLNVDGWNTYFWLAFLPLILLLLVGAKLEHIISRLAQDVKQTGVHANESAIRVRPSDEHFWFNNPRIVLNLIHFILFQNSFEIAFFFWIWSTYGIHSCIMEKLGYIIARLFMGVIVQVLCSYSTLPLYTIVTQMGSLFKEGMFDDWIGRAFGEWAGNVKSKREDSEHKMITNESSTTVDVAEQEMVAMERITNVLPCQVQPPSSSS